MKNILPKRKPKPVHYLVVASGYRARRYGGANYKLSVYRVAGVGNVRFVDDGSRCTAYHKGEASEALTIIKESGDLPPAMAKALDDYVRDNTWVGKGYYSHVMADDLGLYIQIVTH